MKNVYDIRYEENLVYILPEREQSLSQNLLSYIHSETAIIIYLYYIDTLHTYYKYIDNIPSDIDVYIISSREDVLNNVKEYMMASSQRKTYYMLKENSGHDISALLISSRDIIAQYKYVCFLHDKKEHIKEKREDIQLWIENLWGNQIGGAGYIDDILGLFHNNEQLGILAPPEPIGEYFDTWYGFGWYASFDITKKLADMLRLNADIRLDKPPITFGTVLWFKSDAIQKLFDREWHYSDFDDKKLGTDTYISYGVERIFAYVAQDAGYKTGTVMTVSYAEKQTAYIQHAIGSMFNESYLYFPVNNLVDLKYCKRNRSRIVEFARKNKEVYLYGAGKIGRICLRMLQVENILPAGYIVSIENGVLAMEGIPIIAFEKLDNLKNIAVIITVYDLKAQQEIAEKLESNGCYRYIKF